MDWLTTTPRVILAAVLAVAAVGTFLDLTGARRAVREFGVPDDMAAGAANALPVVELGLAIGLLAQATAPWAALLAALLFLAFIVAIGCNVRKGQQPDCRCFGLVHSEPSGWALARNGALALAAAVVVWQGGANPIDWAGELSTAGRLGAALGIAILAAAATVAWLLYRLMRQNQRILARLDRFGRPENVPTAVAEADALSPRMAARIAPEFDLPDLDGHRLTLKGLLEDGLPTLLIFSDPNCGPCNTLLPDVGEWQRRYADEVRVALISRRSIDENRIKSAVHGISFVGLQKGREIDELFAVDGTPTGILVQPDGTIRHRNALGPRPIRALFSRTLTNRQRARRGQPELSEDVPAFGDDEHPFARLPTALEVGAPAPALPLRDLKGHFTGLEDFRGQETVVLFMSPGCIFSQRLLADLHEWAQEGAGDVLQRTVTVSDGTAEETGEMKLPGHVLLDDGFTLGRAFGAGGTPAAVLVDADGRVASSLATGEDAVLDLLYDQCDGDAALAV